MPDRSPLGLVDPRCGWQLGRCWWLADEPLGVGGVGGLQHPGPLGADLLGPAVVEVGGGVEPDPGVAMLGVVPAEEPGAEAVGVLIGAEPVGELGPLLEGLELGLAVRGSGWSSNGAGCGSW